MGMYSQFYKWPNISEMMDYATYGSIVFWPIPGITEVRRCHICKREESRFVKLISMFVNDEFIYECQYHGGKNGKLLNNCDTGDLVYIPPEPHRIIAFLRNYYQDFTLNLLIIVRFAWFYSRAVFYYLLTRNDTITVFYRKITGI